MFSNIGGHMLSTIFFLHCFSVKIKYFIVIVIVIIILVHPILQLVFELWCLPFVEKCIFMILCKQQFNISSI